MENTNLKSVLTLLQNGFISINDTETIINKINGTSQEITVNNENNVVSNDVYLEKFRVLSELLKHNKPAYDNPITRSAVVRMFEMNIYKLPLNDSKQLFTGYISEEAIKLLKNSNQKNGQVPIDREHFYPRNYVINMLFTDWYDYTQDPQKFMDLYFNKFGRFHLTTSSENNKLKEFQSIDVFTTPEKSYEDAGIKLVKISEELWGELFMSISGKKWWRCRRIENVLKHFNSDISITNQTDSVNKINEKINTAKEIINDTDFIKRPYWDKVNKYKNVDKVTLHPMLKPKRYLYILYLLAKSGKLEDSKSNLNGITYANIENETKTSLKVILKILNENKNVSKSLINDLADLVNSI